jgi:16S rRNA (cytosine967-C5)-methyltransferase
MSVAASQARTFLGLLRQLAPHLGVDPQLPKRIQVLLARNRAFGSRDRRLYRELIYTTVRYLPWIQPSLEAEPNEVVRRVAWLAAELPATHGFRAAFATGEPPSGHKAELLPGWFRPHCPEIFSGPELETQLRRAPLWLRVRADALAGAAKELESRGWGWRPSNVLPNAIEVLGDVDVTATESFRQGLIEVQDLGSQLLLETIGIQPGENWLDACAGAGGKSLQLAALVGPRGSVTAWDIRPAALEELRARASRAGVDTIRVAAPQPAAEFDGVLVDAPCSGSGTWRRQPHLKWITRPESIAEKAAVQRALLHGSASHVRPGGRLVYATCSLSCEENEQVITAFLAEHPEFRAEAFARTFDATPRGPGLLILPGLHDSDGFFVASLRRY